ncbi:hypothetical protein BU26DRAFT_504991 [Trematosphaeria pertusa]|uniref:Uncharacterized protein n=1 Tax=Trematosphaeria pertusa TaxID=390896 RepID=A0A6A6IH25_9PLEO|nr:uncharacterized protein BU26DRAFT_504991 [Trematosphaeria pertusa]KAF2248860.1 hypothetical protein BU26DRAFT_504991 [Trematosphaeria pertusa]
MESRASRRIRKSMKRSLVLRDCLPDNADALLGRYDYQEGEPPREITPSPPVPAWPSARESTPYPRTLIPLLAVVGGGSLPPADNPPRAVSHRNTQIPPPPSHRPVSHSRPGHTQSSPPATQIPTSSHHHAPNPPRPSHTQPPFPSRYRPAAHPRPPSPSSRSSNPPRPAHQPAADPPQDRALRRAGPGHILVPAARPDRASNPSTPPVAQPTSRPDGSLNPSRPRDTQLSPPPPSSPATQLPAPPPHRYVNPSRRPNPNAAAAPQSPSRGPPRPARQHNTAPGGNQGVIPRPNTTGPSNSRPEAHQPALRRPATTLPRNPVREALQSSIPQAPSAPPSQPTNTPPEGTQSRIPQPGSRSPSRPEASQAPAHRGNGGARSAEEESSSPPSSWNSGGTTVVGSGTPSGENSRDNTLDVPKVRSRQPASRPRVDSTTFTAPERVEGPEELQATLSILPIARNGTPFVRAGRESSGPPAPSSPAHRTPEDSRPSFAASPDAPADSAPEDLSAALTHPPPDADIAGQDAILGREVETVQIQQPVPPSSPDTSTSFAHRYPSPALAEPPESWARLPTPVLTDLARAERLYRPLTPFAPRVASPVAAPASAHSAGEGEERGEDEAEDGDGDAQLSPPPSVVLGEAPPTQDEDEDIPPPPPPPPPAQQQQPDSASAPALPSLRPSRFTERLSLDGPAMYNSAPDPPAEIPDPHSHHVQVQAPVQPPLPQAIHVPAPPSAARMLLRGMKKSVQGWGGKVKTGRGDTVVDGRLGDGVGVGVQRQAKETLRSRARGVWRRAMARGRGRGG